MFSIFRKNKEETLDEEREGNVASSVEPKAAKRESTRTKHHESSRSYNLGCQSKLNRKFGGRMFDDYPG